MHRIAPHPVVAARHLDSAQRGIENANGRKMEGVESTHRLGRELLAGAPQDVVFEREDVARALEGCEPALRLTRLAGAVNGPVRR